MRSTGQSNRKRAQKVCEAFARIAEEESRGDTSRAILEQVVNDTLRRLGHETIKVEVSASAWLQQWLANERGAITQSTFNKYRAAISQFLASLGTRAQTVKLVEITDQDIIRFRDQLLAGGRTPGTVNFLIQGILKRPFRVACDSGVIERNPIALVRPIKGTKATKGTFTVAQISQLLSTLDGDWKGLILAGWYTGGRLGDLSRLCWASVDLEAQTITFAQGKTGGVVKIPLHPELEAWLLAQPRAQRGAAEVAFVFPTLCDKPLAGDSGLSAAFTRMVRKAGIDGGLIREGKGRYGRSVSSLSFHSLRASFNSNLANSGISQEQRMLLTGHRSVSENDKYTRLTMTSLRTAIDVLPRLG
jgi:integrase